MAAYRFLGWRDATAMRPATWSPDWSTEQKRAYDEGYDSV